MARSRARSRRATPVEAAPKPEAEAAEAEAPEAPEAPEAAAPEVEAAAELTTVVKLTKRELLSRVSSAAGVRRRVARPVMEAVLAELGEALSRGEQLNLHPFGKAVVNRTRDGANAEVLIVKLRRNKPGPEDAVPPPDADPLAEAAE